MSNDLIHIVIVGAALAGLRAAETLRGEGFCGELTIIGSEQHAPYDRPPLSKDFLLGKAQPADIVLCDDERRAALGAEWLLGRTATGMRDGAVTLDDGRTVRADGIVIATGARARRLPGTAALDGVHTLRTLDDAIRLRDHLATAARVVIIGAGFVGTEVASTATTLDRDVTVVDTADHPFHTQLGPVAADLLCRTMQTHGVRLRTGVGVAGIEGGPRVTGVGLTDGTRLDADLVLVGIGATPNTEWLAGSAVRCADGVLTDGWGRTSVPRVVAAGDVASVERPGGRLRNEHWTNARDMPTVAAGTLLADAAGRDPGDQHPADPYFWSEQFGERIQLAGRICADVPVQVVEGAVENGRFVGVQHRDGMLNAVLGWSMPREFTRWRRRNRDALRASC